MMLVRDVFHAHFGKGGELVALFKEARQKYPGPYARRVLTDASGQFYTVTAETQVASLAEWEKVIAGIFSNPDFVSWFQRVALLVESGSREFHNIETSD